MGNEHSSDNNPGKTDNKYILYNTQLQINILMWFLT